ncbi:class I SAM-dependent methyltransferase [Mycolicibacterium rufum]|uniref:Class I SAM-dependent methyltransferase n=1 Tax=Mycolicibacterium rufum TaxID=318424 RepID=A0A9X3BEA9_9MYCO|nr:class I SAM-dependent methyltransferase [Mycolicibacterium rufum]KGI68538.1 methyltransferase [Mycolicibacterium rufum]MCV7069638.1 class I SAM-dependent methyltransferase [Mycolicibacterium rufum]ULP34668.1 class I SAM-dependent methyltransferase [Mycolicibacterium rufum]
MGNSLTDPRIATALRRMYAEAEDQMAALQGGKGAEFARLAAATAQQRADAMSDYYLPVTPDAGRLLYALVRAAKPATVVEFGMSLGISALHLAAAVRDNGHGHVITTELSAAKVAAATETFIATGLDDLVTVLAGDALETLPTLEGAVDFVLLDGWKELYLPVLELLEPRLSSGALVVADNTSMPGLAPYLDRMRDPAHGYVTVSFPVRGGDSMELSCRTV